MLNFIVWLSTFLDPATSAAFAFAAVLALLLGWKRGFIALGGLSAMLAASPLYGPHVTQALIALPSPYLYAIALLGVIKSLWISIAALAGPRAASRSLWTAGKVLIAVALFPVVFVASLLWRGRDLHTQRLCHSRIVPKSERLLHVARPSIWALSLGPIELLTCRILVTDKRVLKVSGLIARHLTEWLRRDLTAVDLEQRWWGRLTNSGDLVLHARGRAPATIPSLHSPWEAAQTIRTFRR